MNNLQATKCNGGQAEAGCCFAPRVDILENDNEVVFFADLPGVKPEDVDLQFEGGELRLVARAAAHPEGHRFLSEEYGLGDFYRAFTVPQQVDPGRISADLKHGVLTVRLPKPEAIKPKKISVQGA